MIYPHHKIRPVTSFNAIREEGGEVTGDESGRCDVVDIRSAFDATCM